MTPKKLFFVMIGCLGVTAAITLGVIYQTDKYLGEQSAEIGVLKAQDELLSTELINAQQVREKLKEYSYLDNVTDEILPDSKNQSEVILLINQIGSEASVDITSFTFLGTDGQPSEKSQTEPLEGAGGILVFPVSIRFDASYSQLLSWLTKAEQNQRKMQVTALSIGKSAENPSELTVNIEINAYLEK